MVRGIFNAENTEQRMRRTNYSKADDKWPTMETKRNQKCAQIRLGPREQRTKKYKIIASKNIRW